MVLSIEGLKDLQGTEIHNFVATTAYGGLNFSPPKEIREYFIGLFRKFDVAGLKSSTVNISREGYDENLSFQLEIHDIVANVALDRRIS
jgi:hypothetical protein